MAARIRLSRFGRRGIALYRIVVADKESPRDGKNIEILGQYDPRGKDTVFKYDKERLNWWIAKGATCSDTVRNLLKRFKE